VHRGIEAGKIRTRAKQEAKNISRRMKVVETEENN
jgi:hypothetical protein